MKDERTEAIRALLGEISAWPWKESQGNEGRPGCNGIQAADADGRYDEIVTTDSGYYGPHGADADFIIAAPSNIAYLLARIDALAK